MGYIRIGKIVNTHGIRGELKIQSYSDFDDERYRKNNTVYILFENHYVPFRVATFRIHKGMSIVSFQQHQNINDVEKYKNCDIYIDEADRKPLRKGEFFQDQLIGLSVYDEQDVLLGVVCDVESTNGAQNNIRMKMEADREVLIPYVPVFIRNVDLDEKKIVIHVQEGLL